LQRDGSHIHSYNIDYASLPNMPVITPLLLRIIKVRVLKNSVVKKVFLPWPSFSLHILLLIVLQILLWVNSLMYETSHIFLIEKAHLLLLKSVTLCWYGISDKGRRNPQ
jgi:hypothetical protein